MGGDAGNRKRCSVKVVIIQERDREGLSEGRCVGMRAEWIREI